VGVLGERRLRRFEQSTREVLHILIHPLVFIRKTYSAQQPLWLYLMLLFLYLVNYLIGGLVPLIAPKHLASIPVLPTLWAWFFWGWGLPRWLHLVIPMALFVPYVCCRRSYFCGRPVPLARLGAALNAAILIYFIPAIPYLALWYGFWFALLTFVSSLAWVMTLPIQLGFALQQRLGLSGAYESAGVILLGISFALQLIATF